MRIERVPITHPDARALIDVVQAEYVVRYGGPDESPIDPAEFDDPVGAFYVGYDGDVPVAIGAWRRRSVDALGSSASAEVKRMFVLPTHQRRGLARQLLGHLELTAARAGVEVLVLETGTAQPEAIALYEAAGYVAVPGFGHYRDSPLSRCFGRRIDAGGVAAWDTEAETFDDEPDHGLHDPATRSAWRDLLLGVLPAAPARVTDLGCGTGTLTALLDAEGYDVTGLDFAPAMLERARAKVPGATFVLGDAQTPDLPAGSCGAVVVRHVLWAMRDPADAVRRWTELLADDGVLVLVEGRWHTGAGLPSSETVALTTAAGLEVSLRPMPEPVFWGSDTGDERYLVTGTQRS